MEQASWLPEMVIREPFDPRPQHSESLLVPIKVPHEIQAGPLDTIRVRIKVGLVRIKADRHPSEVMILGRKIVSEWRKHRDESVAPMCQGKDKEPAEDVGPVETTSQRHSRRRLAGRKRQLREALGHWGRIHRREGSSIVSARLLLCFVCSTLVRCLSHSLLSLLVLLCDSWEQGDRKRVEVELFQDVVDQVRALVVSADAIEGVTGGIHQQCWDFNGLEFRRNGRVVQRHRVGS